MSGYLLDSHAFLWWVAGDERVGADVRTVASTSTRVLVSDVSLWEFAVKTATGKLRFAPDLRRWFEQHMTRTRFGRLRIEQDHLVRVAELPMHHRDPFDRLLISQAIAEDLTVITAGQAFGAYGVRTLW